tara:strand:+ start:282 stop:731 length:450 start_codon:yes stop_codon:yes gene_type:complete
MNNAQGGQMLTYKNKKADDNLTTFIMGSDNPEFSVRFEKFMQAVEILNNEHTQRWTHLHTRNPRVEATWGKKYIKLTYRESGHGRVYGFVDMTNGNILYPAGYNQPTKKNPRGNIWNDDYGVKCLGDYGVGYAGQTFPNDWIVEIVNGE